MKRALTLLLLLPGVWGLSLRAQTAASAPPKELGGLTSHAAGPARAATADLPPPSDDPRDFEGVWLPARTGAPPPDGKPSILGEPSGASPGGSPMLQCAPMMRLGGAGGGMSDQWIQDANELVMISEEDQDIRKIYLHAKHPGHLPAQANGDSIGHWEGNTLLVDSIGFTDTLGRPTDQHVVERIQKIHTDQGWQLRHEDTISLNGKVRQQVFIENWRPDLHVFENICEENWQRYEIENGEVVNPNIPPSRAPK